MRSTKLAFINALLPAGSGEGRLPQSLHPEALQQEVAQLQQQIARVTAECQADKELLTGQVSTATKSSIGKQAPKQDADKIRPKLAVPAEV